MYKFILVIALSLGATISTNAATNTMANPFLDGKEIVEHPLFTNAKGGSECKGLPRTCGQMTNCEQAKLALRCGNKKLDRDKDGVPCETICTNR